MELPNILFKNMSFYSHCLNIYKDKGELVAVSMYIIISKKFIDACFFIVWNIVYLDKQNKVTIQWKCITFDVGKTKANQNGFYFNKSNSGCLNRNSVTNHRLLVKKNYALNGSINY